MLPANRRSRRYRRFCKAYDAALSRVMHATTRRELTRVYRWCCRLERENPTHLKLLSRHPADVIS